MSSQISVEDNKVNVEEIRRNFIIATFALLKGLAIHDAKNAAIQRPLESFLTMLQQLLHEVKGSTEVEYKFQDNLFTLMGAKVMSHFSIVEAQKEIMDCLERSCIDSLAFQKDVTPEEVAKFFSSWAFHLLMNSKPKPFSLEVGNIKIVEADPERQNSRLKNKDLLLNPRFVLEKFYFLRAHTEEFFKLIVEGKMPPHSYLRRDIIELIDVARVSPYQLAALSLVRDRGMEKSGLHSLVSQATTTAILGLILARELNFSVRDQVNFGLAALLYNVGLLGSRAAPSLKNDQLNADEYQQVLDAQASGVFQLLQLHGSSRAVLERLLSIFEVSKGTVVDSFSLTLESRMLKLASQYAAMTSERPYRDPYTPHEAIQLLGSKAIKKKDASELDPILYFLFVRFMGVYPVGSLCKLSDGRKAVVFRPFGEVPRVPIVKIVPDADNPRPTLIDLSQVPGLQLEALLDAREEGIDLLPFFFA